MNENQGKNIRRLNVKDITVNPDQEASPSLQTLIAMTQNGCDNAERQTLRNIRNENSSDSLSEETPKL